MKKLEEAIIYATEKHAGMVDKTGYPAIFHPLRVMQAMVSPKAQIVAVLHDTVEDTDATLEEIKEKFGVEIAIAVGLLTHQDSEPLNNYFTRISTNHLAVEVKIADMRDNMSPYRMNGLSEKTRERMLKKYEKGFRILLGD